MKNTIIAILVVVVLALGFIIFNQKKSEIANTPWSETEPAHTSPTSGNPTTGTNPCSPSITVSAPATGAAYNVGQKVTVKWTTCGVSKVSLGLISGGKDHGMITQTPISASTGSYQWTATNPGKGFTNQNTNSYQIVVSSDEGSIMAKSGVFTVTTPESNSSVSTTISSSYISGTEWPPTIQTSSIAYSCHPSNGEVSTVVQKVIDGTTYCISSSIEGGAGHMGGDYIYTKANGNGTKMATFKLYWANCGVYQESSNLNDPSNATYNQCKADQANVFDNLDAMVDSLM